MSADPIRVPVAVIPKNTREEIHVGLDQYAGCNLIDVRIFALFGGNDVFCPTKKGVAVSTSKLDDLIAALTEAKAQAQAMGWV